MKKILSNITKLFSKEKENEIENTPSNCFKTFSHGGAFSVDAPSHWTQNQSDYLSLSAPNDEINITVSCYNKPDGDLESFTDYRFQAVHDCYNQIGEEEKIEDNIIYRSYEGIWPEETEPTYYKVACIQIGQSFGSIGFTTQIKENMLDHQLYQKIITSLKINS